MAWIFTVAGVLLMAFGRYRQAKQQGVWHGKFFFGLMGAVGLFVGLVIVPVCRSALLDTHPAVALVMMLGGGLAFVVGVVVVARKVSKGWVVQEPSNIAPVVSGE